ncbi:alkaline ceramidase [Planctomicrobium sp. SH664]|uniref:alkaline ceramidase n=1 Tax=Planctomicrobium sp. SH664 TaxID=3448125 RepID=UPI003F5BCDCE
MNEPDNYSSFQGEIGTASVEITPPVGVYARNWGAARHDVAASVHRALTLNVLTLRESSGGLPLILIEADLGFWRELTFLNTILDAVTADHHVGRERVIFSLTHTHAGPRIVDTTDEVPGGDLLRPWMQSTIAIARNAVTAALRSAQPSLLDWHVGRCQLAANRDLRDPSSARVLVGYSPGAPADQTMLVGRVTSPDGKIRAVLVNYACHPTTLAFDNAALSPDFVGAFRETVSANVSGAHVFFLQGASGELAPRYQYVGDSAVADRHGRQLAFAALATLEDMEPPGTALQYQGVVESGAPLAIWKPVEVPAATTLEAAMSTVELDLKDLPTVAEIEELRKVSRDRALTERLNRKLDVRRKVGDGSTFAMPVLSWKIGNTLLVGTMAESYSAFQTEIRQQFSQQPVVCMNMINGWIGYLAPAELYDEDLYQVWQSPFARGSLERTISAAVDLLSTINQSASSLL